MNLDIRNRVPAAALAVFLVLIAGTAHAGKLEKVSNSGSVATDSRPEVDLGQVPMDGGAVKKVFELYNGETTDLVLKGAFTSCACTRAYIELPDGEKSPSYGQSMPRGWYRTIKPGQKFKVHVNFNPAFHGRQGLGPFKRDVFLVTSATADDNMSTMLPLIRHGTVTSLRMTGTVVEKVTRQNRDKPPKPDVRIGDFLFPAREIDLGVVKQSQGAVSRTVPFIYDGAAPVRITGTPASCACTRAAISSNTLAPGQEGTLTVTFDPNYHQEPKGRFFKDVLVLTEPKTTREVSIRMWAEVDVDLGPEAYKSKEPDDDEDEHREERAR